MLVLRTLLSYICNPCALYEHVEFIDNKSDQAELVFQRSAKQAQAWEERKEAIKVRSSS